jgi:AraC family transcriptional regulator, arabinose operon regulatory protein
MYIHHIALNMHHSKDFFYERKHGASDFLMLYFKTPCHLVIESVDYEINTPSVVLFEPATPHSYLAQGGVYIDDYFNFASPNAKDFLDRLAFPTNIPIPITDGKAISDTLHAIHFEHNESGKQNSPLIDHYIFLLLYYIAEQWDHVPQVTEVLDQPTLFYQLREKIMSNIEFPWKVDVLAKELKLSPSYFQVRYTHYFQKPFYIDLLQSRLEIAKDLLKQTDLSIAQIALHVGYNHSDSLSRQFKKHTTMTPIEYRKSLTSSGPSSF